MMQAHCGVECKPTFLKHLGCAASCLELGAWHTLLPCCQGLHTDSPRAGGGSFQKGPPVTYTVPCAEHPLPTSLLDPVVAVPVPEVSSFCAFLSMCDVQPGVDMR